MMTRADVKIALQALLDFLIVAGTTLGGAMLQSGQPVMPTPAVQILAVIIGAVAAARRIQSMLEGKPQETIEQTVKQLVAQMRTVQVVAAQTLPDPPPPVPARRLEDVIAKAEVQAKLDAAAAAVAAAPLAPVTPQKDSS
jgi:hypothetical protein